MKKSDCPFQEAKAKRRRNCTETRTRRTTPHTWSNKSLGLLLLPFLLDATNSWTVHPNRRHRNTFRLHNSRDDFYRSLRDFTKPNRTNNNKSDPLQGYSLQQLEAFANAQLPKSNRNDNDDGDNTESDGIDNREAPILDPDRYLEESRAIDVSDDTLYQTDSQYREAMNDYAKATSMRTDFERRDWEELWNLIRQRGGIDATANYNAQTAQRLHDQVFAHEGGFLQNSHLFLESLTNPNKTAQATYSRRSQRYLQRQQVALRELDDQLQNFTIPQDLPEPSNATTTVMLCQQCRCRLDGAEAKRRLCRVCYQETVLAQQQKQSAINNNNNNRPPKQKATLRRGSTTALPRSRLARQLNPRYAITNSGSLSKHRRSTDESMEAPIKVNGARGRPSSLSTTRNQESPNALERTTTSTKNGLVASHSKQAPQRSELLEITAPPHRTNESIPAESFSSRNEPGELPPISEKTVWMETTDPDTGEIFFWNKVTGEMQWELEEGDQEFWDGDLIW